MTSNDTRAERAQAALRSYVLAKGDEFEASINEITDLIADLQHLAAFYASEDGNTAEDYIERALRLSRLHFDAENSNPEEEAEQCPICGDHHEADAVPFTCQTGDGV